MKNLETPYACGLCKKEFHKSISLVKHVDLRHPKASKQFSTLSHANDKSDTLKHLNIQNKNKAFSKTKVEKILDQFSDKLNLPWKSIVYFKFPGEIKFINKLIKNLFYFMKC